MRYRIQTEDGRVWDTKQKRLNSITSGEYKTYKTFGIAVSVASKAGMQWRYKFVIVEDTEFAGCKKYKTLEEARSAQLLSKIKEY